MSTSSATLGRPAERKEKIVRELRDRIIQGKWEPGTQLPTRPEIESCFGASSLTVQRALEELRSSGFVTVTGRQGTFVARNPPHLTNYVLAFPAVPSDAHWPNLWTALDRVAGSMVPAQDFRLATYHDINGAVHSHSFLELTREVLGHRVAGLIFAALPSHLEETPLLQEPGIPRVMVASPHPRFPLPLVALDRLSFFQRAFELLVSRGCKKVAVLGRPGLFREKPRILPLLEAHALETRPQWWQCASINDLEGAGSVTHLLMSQMQSERPDCLVISDDNLVPSALTGLKAAGIDPGDGLTIIAHCNWVSALDSPYDDAVTLLGFDIRSVLQACIGVINCQRHGGLPPAVTSIPAVLRREL